MSEIAFYHLQRQGLSEGLPKLAAKVLQVGMHAVIKFGDKATLTVVDKALWTYDANSFLPHDKAGCDHAEDQGLFLTTSDENPNDARVLMLVNGVDASEISGFERVLYMFDGNDPDITAKARSDWKIFKDGAFKLTYWQQKDEGGWEQKA